MSIVSSVDVEQNEVVASIHVRVSHQNHGVCVGCMRHSVEINRRWLGDIEVGIRQNVLEICLRVVFDSAV
jgi:predicted Fe-S protein YdhL (DUF1289 family)